MSFKVSVELIGLVVLLMGDVADIDVIDLARNRGSPEESARPEML
jgi:hypothetical protein